MPDEIKRCAESAAKALNSIPVDKREIAAMDVFDSMEPWRQAEQLAADADFRESVLPKCARCGYPITDSKGGTE